MSDVALHEVSEVAPTTTAGTAAQLCGHSSDGNGTLCQKCRALLAGILDADARLRKRKPSSEWTKTVRRAVVTPHLMPDELPQFCTVKQAANYLQTSEWAIREGVKQGRIPNVGGRFGRRAILIPREFFATVSMQVTP